MCIFFIGYQMLDAVVACNLMRDEQVYRPFQPAYVCFAYCVRVLIQEQQGNILIFVSSVGGVTDLVRQVETYLSHDPDCKVLSLYSALDAVERTQVTAFDDFDRFPGNRGKRLICVATNIAEGGIPIPGRSYLLPSGQFSIFTRLLAKTQKCVVFSFLSSNFCICSIAEEHEQVQELVACHCLSHLERLPMTQQNHITQSDNTATTTASLLQASLQS